MIRLASCAVAFLCAQACFSSFWIHAPREGETPRLTMAALGLSSAVPAANSVTDSQVKSGERVAKKIPATDTAAPDTAAPDVEDADAGRQAAIIKDCLSRLSNARQLLEQTEGYSAVFHQQVRIGDEVLSPEEMKIKVRHEPYSVYLHWETSGQEALYVDGKHDGRILVKPAGILGFRTLRLAPDSQHAMKTSRYPITEIGLKTLVDRLIEHRENDLDRLDAFQIRQADDVFDGVDGIVYRIEYKHKNANPPYRVSVIHLDRETDLPVSVKNTAWSGEQEGLLEHYVYRELNLAAALTETDFSEDNPAYDF